MNGTGGTVLTIVLALIAAGGAGYVRDLIVAALKRRRDKLTPAAAQQAAIHEAVRQADESLIVTGRSRDALVADNERLRAERTEIERRHALDRAEWARERAELRAEIEEMEARWRKALDDLGQLKARHGLTGPVADPQA